MVAGVLAVDPRDRGAAWGLLAPPSISREMVPHIPNLGRDLNSKFKVQFLTSVYHFHTIINLKNLKFQPPQVGDGLHLRWRLQEGPRPGGICVGSVFEAPLGAAWGTQEAGLAWGCTKGDGGL